MGLDGLSDNVPPVHLPVVATHHGVEVGGQRCPHLCGVGDGYDVIRVAAARDEAVALYRHVVFLGEVDETVQTVEVEDPLLGLDEGPLHLVFGRQAVELPRQHLGELRVGEIVRRPAVFGPFRGLDGT